MGQLTDLDLWDVSVSLVDGYNLPMRIDNNQGCPVGECPVDLGPHCKPHHNYYHVYSGLANGVKLMLGPAQLKGPFDSTGFPVGCKSACVANLDGNQSDYHFSILPSKKSLLT